MDTFDMQVHPEEIVDGFGCDPDFCNGDCSDCDECPEFGEEEDLFLDDDE